MAKKIMHIGLLITGVLCIQACTDEAEEPKQPESRATITSSISNDPDAAKRETFNREMVESMYEDDAILAELIPGEAYRRGIPVDHERLDEKRAREKQNGVNSES